MKKIYQEVMIEFMVDDDVNIDEVLSELKVDVTDPTGHTEDSIDYEFRHIFVEEDR